MSARHRLHRLLLPLEARLRRRVVGPVRDLVQRRRRATVSGDQREEPSALRHRVLIALHRAPGGTMGTTLDLLRSLPAEIEVDLLLGDLFALHLFRVRRGGRLEWLESHRPPVPWSNTRRHDAWYAEVYRRTLRDRGIDLLHVRHLLGHTLDLLTVAAEQEVPVVLSLHDFYLACPGYQLLDEKDRFCAGRCTPGTGQCRLPIRWLWDLPRMKGPFVEQWRDEVGAALAGVDVAVTTSQSARDLLLELLPQLRSIEVLVVEHGRDLERTVGGPPVPEPGGTIRIAFPGRLERHKGTDLIRRLAELDRRSARRLEMHFVGSVDSAVRGLGTHHGAYRREELVDRLGQIRPHFAGLLSVAPETYSHTLTEVWAAGVPALVSDRGALRERVERHGGGWVLPIDDPSESYRRILAAADDPAEYRRRAAQAREVPSRSIAEMAEDYVSIYRRSLATAGVGRVARRHLPQGPSETP